MLRLPHVPSQMFLKVKLVYGKCHLDEVCTLKNSCLKINDALQISEKSLHPA